MNHRKGLRRIPEKDSDEFLERYSDGGVECRQIPERNSAESPRGIQKHPRKGFRRIPERDSDGSQRGIQMNPRKGFRRIPERNSDESPSRIQTNPREGFKRIPERNLDESPRGIKTKYISLWSTRQSQTSNNLCSNCKRFKFKPISIATFPQFKDFPLHFP